MCILFVNTLSIVVNYYGLSFLSMSVMGFQKKCEWGWVRGVSSIQVYFGCLEFVLTLQSPLPSLPPSPCQGSPTPPSRRSQPSHLCRSQRLPGCPSLPITIPITMFTRFMHCQI